MEQQDAKNIITLEEFLTKLEGIISSFKEYVDTTNKRIDRVEENIATLTKRIGDNNANIKELTRDFGLQKDKIINQIDDVKRSNSNNLAATEGSLVAFIEDLKKTVQENSKKNPGEKKPASNQVKQKDKKPTAGKQKTNNKK